MLQIERWLLPLALGAFACNGDAGGTGAPGEQGEEEAAAPEASALNAAAQDAFAGFDLPNNFPFLTPTGTTSTFSKAGSIDLGSDFFEDFGTNGRTCASCHRPQQGWSISAAGVRQRFNASGGLDPIFRPVDGANSPNADVSTVEARRAAYSMLLDRGVIRVGRPVPADAEFELVEVDDPYGFASAAELSLFRRPLASTNLEFNAQIMWDGRETRADLRAALASQADNATLGHAEAAAPLPDVVRAAVVDFELALFTAQQSDWQAGPLDAAGARGGPQALAGQTFVAGSFDLYSAWAGLTAGGSVNMRRRAIARGQALFNDPNPGVGGNACRSCHDAANVGTSAAGVFFNIGVSSASRRTPDLPLYTLQNKATGQTRRTTDPGRALATGRWSDIDLFKAPSLRALSSRAPYFHNGSVETIEQVVRFYEVVFGFAFTDSERADLVAFLEAL
jgi:cytochrome c peroxidase